MPSQSSEFRNREFDALHFVPHEMRYIQYSRPITWRVNIVVVFSQGHGVVEIQQLRATVLCQTSFNIFLSLNSHIHKDI